MATLIFIDTNVLLRFYELAGKRDELSILKHISSNLEMFISTVQVEMEYFKRRQNVILNALNDFSIEKHNLKRVPAFLSATPTSKKMSKLVDEMKNGDVSFQKLRAQLREEAKTILTNPDKDDPVYRSVTPLFNRTSALHLKAENSEYDSIVERARTRYRLGYPPRKPKYLSIGDAVNWEWIISCASRTSNDVIIVSGDTDYGLSQDGKLDVVNDWLAREFKARTSNAQNVTLTSLLSEALKSAGVDISEAEEKHERSQLRRRTPSFRTSFLDSDLAGVMALASLSKAGTTTLDDHILRILPTLALAETLGPQSMSDSIIRAAQDFVEQYREPEWMSRLAELGKAAAERVAHDSDDED